MRVFPKQDRRNAYHQSMLRYVGCNADTDLLSATFGDEIALRQDLVGLDMGNRAELGRVFVQAFKRLYYDLEPDAQRAGDRGRRCRRRSRWLARC